MLLCQTWSNQRKACHTGNTTIVVSVASHPYVAFITPACAPRILDQPVLVTIISICAITNNQHCMVQAMGATLWLIIHTCKHNDYELPLILENESVTRHTIHFESKKLCLSSTECMYCGICRRNRNYLPNIN